MREKDVFIEWIAATEIANELNTFEKGTVVSVCFKESQHPWEYMI